MTKSAVTISLVEQARGGPFVLWEGLERSIEIAASLGYDGVGLFLPGPDAVEKQTLAALLQTHSLKVAAVGTGAGWIAHQLSLTDEDDQKCEAAKQFIRRMIDFGAAFDCPAIIGSMQGRHGGAVSAAAARKYLVQALQELGAYAGKQSQTLIYEPLNRYETNLCNTIAQGVDLLNEVGSAHVQLLADMFHMNIEEVDLAAAITEGGDAIGHIHFADSNRHAIGGGHTNVAPVAAAIKKIDYQGWISAEVFALPDGPTAAKVNIDAYNTFFA